MICKQTAGNILNKPEFTHLHTVNGFKYCYLTLLILFNINHLFAQSLNGFKYCYPTLTIQFNISHFFAHG